MNEPRIFLYGYYGCANLGDELLLSVADAGSGFPEVMMGRAFEPYVTTKAKGTGLGLAIVKKIVEEHHGRVTIENRRPRGARVILHFPLEGSLK